MVPLQREGSREWAPSPTLIVPWAPQVRGPRGACPGPPSQSDSPYTDRKVTPPPQALNGSGALGPCTGNTHGSVIILSTWRKLKTLFGRSSARSLTASHSFLDVLFQRSVFLPQSSLLCVHIYYTVEVSLQGLVIPTRQATFLPSRGSFVAIHSIRPSCSRANSAAVSSKRFHISCLSVSGECDHSASLAVTFIFVLIIPTEKKPENSLRTRGFISWRKSPSIGAKKVMGMAQSWTRQRAGPSP